MEIVYQALLELLQLLRERLIETNELFQMFDNNPIVPLDTEATNIELISRII